MTQCRSGRMTHGLHPRLPKQLSPIIRQPQPGKAVNMFSPLFVNVPQLLLLRWRVSLSFMPPLPFLNVARPKHYCCILARSLLLLFWLETVVCNALFRPSLSFCPLSACLIILAVFLLSFPPKTEELQIR